MHINCDSCWATVPGCSATNRFVTMEAAREQVAIRSWMGDEGLLGLPLPRHCCGHSVRVSSAVLYERHRFLPEMVLHHSVLRKILPEALSSCPHFLLCFCVLFPSLDASAGRGKGHCGCCNNCSQSLLGCKAAALHWWNVQICLYKLLCMSASQHCSVKYLKFC